jgi:membrane associated rhomboid family serine protease
MTSEYGYPPDQHEPVLWVRGIGLYAAHVVVAVLVLSMIATSALMAFGGTPVIQALSFQSESVLRGEVWRIVTYILVNPPSLWFVIDMVLVVWFGRELEKTFGRRAFLWLYAGLSLVAPLLLLVISSFTGPTSLTGQRGALALFVAFATLYPNVTLFLNLAARWVAFILVAIYSLIALANRDLLGLLVLWSSAGFAWVFVRHQQGKLDLALPSWPKRPARSAKPTSPSPSPAPRAARPVRVADSRPSETSMAEVDALLDKIARSGLSSLTAAERARLDAAHQHLRRRRGEAR